jgi:hypothetical protein
MALKVGDPWRSNVLNQAFVITGDQVQSLPGLGEWHAERFTGYPAKRRPDGRAALVALSAKPKDYRFDFVLV